MNRGADGDAGGAADLQTDVMRFMAILSLCLVAIFALVHSIPPQPAEAQPSQAKPVPEPPPPVVEAPIVTATAPEPVVAEPEVLEARDVDLQYPQPPQPVVEAPVEAPAPEPTPPAPPAEPVEGFSLRFEDDTALTRLVARNEVGMYAMAGDKAMRMNVNRGSIGFWNASTPKQFHEMEPSTVPQPVLNAYRYRGDGMSVKWGVTLPPGMTRQLNDYLNAHRGGAIVIDADGGLRLEQ